MSTKSVTFDRAAEFYDLTRGYPPGVPEHIGTTIARAGGLSSTSRVLEIGVGTGRVALPVVPHVQAYVGVDLSQPMMERLLSKRTTEPVYVATADATRLPLPAQAFDAVVAVHVFHLIPNWQDAVTEVARVLRPGLPLLHCVTSGQETSPEITALQNVWDAAVPAENSGLAGVGPQDFDAFLLSAGWQPRTPEIYNYTMWSSAQRFLDYREQRLISPTWHLTDAELERGVQAIRAHIAAHHADPHQQLAMKLEFKVLVYEPPTST